jgi:hypothetical protein
MEGPRWKDLRLAAKIGLVVVGATALAACTNGIAEAPSTEAPSIPTPNLPVALPVELLVEVETDVVVITETSTATTEPTNTSTSTSSPTSTQTETATSTQTETATDTPTATAIPPTLTLTPKPIPPTVTIMPTDTSTPIEPSATALVIDNSDCDHMANGGQTCVWRLCFLVDYYDPGYQYTFKAGFDQFWAIPSWAIGLINQGIVKRGTCN